MPASPYQYQRFAMSTQLRQHYQLTRTKVQRKSQSFSFLNSSESHLLKLLPFYARLSDIYFYSEVLFSLSLCHQGMATLSIAPTSEKRHTPIAERIAIAANTRSV